MPPPITEELGPLFGPVAAVLWAVVAEPVILLYLALDLGLAAQRTEVVTGEVVGGLLGVAVVAAAVGVVTAGVAAAVVLWVTLAMLGAALRRAD